jgi:SAM-dependent methyltransferase
MIGARFLQNIIYRGDAIGNFYRTHRRSWSEFYPSERRVFETLAMRRASFATVLDVGGAAGGLGEALEERFGAVRDYVSVDINRQAIEAGSQMSSRLSRRRFIAADICDCPALAGERFTLVTALSVADWNVDASGIVAKCWDHVAEGGHLVLSLRLTDRAGVCDMARSYQDIWFEPSAPPEGVERAPYNVFNANEAIRWLRAQTPAPAMVHLHGYWGRPSRTAHTPYHRLLFSVIALRKGNAGETPADPVVESEFPSDIKLES